MVKTLRHLLTRTALELLTSATTFARGVAYHEQGRVVSCTVSETQLSATVQGGQPYQVQFWVRGNLLHFSCTCPFAAEGVCCKHCVAAGLQWMDVTALGKTYRDSKSNVKMIA
jgi:uncharacterized Zn finger protein